jgi:hypothetical protein
MVALPDGTDDATSTPIPAQEEREQPDTSRGDQAETITSCPKSWIAWKREAQRMEAERDEARKERDQWKHLSGESAKGLALADATVSRLTAQRQEAQQAILPVQVHNFKAARELVATHSNRKSRSTLLDTMDNVLLKAEAAESSLTALREALRQLRIDANRLCDRQLGGSYEADCRRSIAAADAALSLTPPDRKEP